MSNNFYRNLLYPIKVWNAVELETRTLSQILRHGYPDRLLQFLGGLGDELMLTCIARELKKRNKDLKIWQISSAASLLRENPDYTNIFDRSFWEMRHSNLLNKARIRFSYSEQLCGEDVWEVPDEHIIVRMLRQGGLTGEVDILPYVYLTEHEHKSGQMADAQICFQSIGGNTHETWMANKVWDHGQLVSVVADLKKKFPTLTSIQLGDKRDSLLDCDIDLRGKTDLRQSAAVLAESRVFVGTQGFLAHLARAVNTRSTIIMGGREHSWQTGYIANINIERFPPCSPCWAMSRCSNGKECMTSITRQDVVDAVLKCLDMYGMPLPIQQVHI